MQLYLLCHHTCFPLSITILSCTYKPYPSKNIIQVFEQLISHQYLNTLEASDLSEAFSFLQGPAKPIQSLYCFYINYSLFSKGAFL